MSDTAPFCSCATAQDNALVDAHKELLRQDALLIKVGDLLCQSRYSEAFKLLQENRK